MAVMTSDTDPVALLERALDQTAGLIAAIEPHQAGLATPCAGWDVRALVSHLAGRDLRNFLVSARGESADWQAPDDEIGDDWAAVVWDRARATGQQQGGLDPALAEHALNWSRGMLRPEFRGPDKSFGLEVPVPEDAPVYDRLAGWF